VVFLASCFCLHAPASSLDGYAQRTWHTEDGLPEETVQSFAQTPDHLFVDRNQRGLVRCDGVQFVGFRRDNTPAIREDSIFSLCVAHDGSLWIGTEGLGSGVNLYGLTCSTAGPIRKAEPERLVCGRTTVWAIAARNIAHTVQTSSGL